MTRLGSFFQLLVAAIVLSSWTCQAHGGESYYLIMFGSLEERPRAKYSHSFATFIRVWEDECVPQRCWLESHTISWLPETLDIRVRAFWPERGHVFELHETIRWALATGQRISMWGPYQIDRDLYCRGLKQIHFLKSGKVRYKAIDSFLPTSYACNCIHAVSSSVSGYRLRVLSPSFGPTASHYILKRFTPWIIDTDCRHEWLVPALGLDCYPMTRRAWGSPSEGALRSLIRSFLRIRDRSE